MSISIKIGTKKIIIYNQMHYLILNNLINEFEKNIIKGCELTISIFDKNTTNFHIYIFEYLSDSILLPIKWLLNNILYSITCDKTNQNMSGIFNCLVGLLRQKYDSLN